MLSILLLGVFSIVGYFLLKTLFFGMGKSLAFGGKISKTLGSVEGQSIRGAKAALTIHALDRLSHGGIIGLDITISTFDGDWQQHWGISFENAKKLAALLEAAAGPESRSGRIKHPGALEEV